MLAEAEVTELEVEGPPPRQEHVVDLEVEMEHVLAVAGGKGGQELEGISADHGLGHRPRRVLDEAVQVQGAAAFEYEDRVVDRHPRRPRVHAGEEDAPVLGEDLDDVRAVHEAHRRRLTVEVRREVGLGVVGAGATDELEDDVAPEEEVVAMLHLAKGAEVDRLPDLKVVTQLPAGAERVQHAVARIECRSFDDGDELSLSCVDRNSEESWCHVGFGKGVKIGHSKSVWWLFYL